MSQMYRVGLFFLLVNLSACVSTVATGSGSNPDRRQLAYLDARLKTLTANPVCDSFTECKSIPSGYAACGGPNRYVVYSVQQANASTVVRLAKERAALERRWLRDASLVSSCVSELPPQLSCRRGRCIAHDR